MKNAMKERLHKLSTNGVWSAILTPLTSDLSIDHGHLVQHAKYLLDQGCHGIGLFGTTGEANSFSLKERMYGLESLLKNGISPNYLMVGTGCCALPDTISLTRHAIENTVKTILLLPPIYYKNVTDDGLFRCFAEVIEKSGSNNIEVYLYHFPAMSQTPISIDLIDKLCKTFPNIIAGIKDSSGKLDHSLALASQFPDLAIFPGNEAYLLAALEQGCAGTITAMANANPRGIRKIFDGWLEEDPAVTSLQKNAFTIREVFSRHPLVSALKQNAAWMSNEDSWLRIRPPLTILDAKASSILRSDLKTLPV